MSPVDLVLIVFGAFAFFAIGSFTCVVIDRLPLALDSPNQFGELHETRPWSQVLGGNSRCSDCGEPIRVWDNIPVVSWIVLRGRCRGCGASIPAYHPIVEVLSPLLFLGAVWSIGEDWRLLPALWLIPVGIAVAVIDQRTLIVPTRIIWPALGVSVILSVAAAGFEGEWRWLVSAAIGLAVLAGPLFIIWFVNPKGMGFGDVRLATLLGFNVGFFAGIDPIGSVLLSICVMAFSAVLGLSVGIVALGARGRKAQVPFGPSMITASVIGIGLAPQILDAFGAYALR